MLGLMMRMSRIQDAEEVNDPFYAAIDGTSLVLDI
jgi:hypothetical protein